MAFRSRPPRSPGADVEKAWAFAADIKKAPDAFWARLQDPGEVTRLPYPGISFPGKRPGYALDFVGTPNVAKVHDAWDSLDDDSRGMYVVGATGIGKSAVMRAFAWGFYAHEPQNMKLVCIWNMTYASRELFQYFKDALYFTFFEDKDALSLIERMVDLSDVEHFLKARKDKGEQIIFLLDGAQALDTWHWNKRPKEDDGDFLKNARAWLARFLLKYQFIFVSSPKASLAEEHRAPLMDDAITVRLDTGFDANSMGTYMDHGILGLLFEKREVEILFYAGRHPLLLHALEDCCRQVAARKMGIRREGVERDEGASYLQDDEDWDDIVIAFLGHVYITTLQTDIDSYLTLEEGKSYHTLKNMISRDKRYAWNENQYCSPFVQRIYVEAFRAKESVASVYDSSPWVAYSEAVLSRTQQNWSEIGWLCDSLYADVISRLGIDLGAGLTIGKLSLIRFKTAKHIQSDLAPGHGYLFLPVTFNFPHTDAIITFKGADGKLCFIGLQFTTSLEQHMHSENEFMSYEVLKEWGVFDDAWELHYAYICLSEEEKFEKKVGNLQTLRDSVTVGTVTHSLHVVSFDTALTKRIGGKSVEVLQKMMRLRKRMFTPTIAPPSGREGVLKLKKLKRRDLDAWARDVNIDPKAHRKKDDLIAALLSKRNV